MKEEIIWKLIYWDMKMDRYGWLIDEAEDELEKIEESC